MQSVGNCHHLSCTSTLYTIFLSLQSLQVCLQGAIESLVLLDRLLYLKEHGIGAKLEPLFDDAISPRNVAIASDTLFCDKLCSN